MKFYSDTQQKSYELFSLLKLQAEVQQVVQLMAKDMRRAGFRKPLGNNSSNVDLFSIHIKQHLFLFKRSTQKEMSCALFLYDADENGCIGVRNESDQCKVSLQNRANDIGRELFGYRLNGNMIETRDLRRTDVDKKCIGTACQQYLQEEACEKGRWVDLLDSDRIKFTRLNFQWLIENKLLKIDVSAQLKKKNKVRYETSIIVPIMNNGGW
ncbi:hypothetical protein GVX81_01865 [[Haemophilus] felis]|nr:hypothetical protein [[Haemophilus] felis]